MNLEPGIRVRVKPVVFYPAGVLEQAVWHQRWYDLHGTAREKFRSMLKGRDTFELAPLHVVHGELTPGAYKNRCFTMRGLVTPAGLLEEEGCSDGVETILAELLAAPFDDGNRYTRYTLPYCLSVLMVDPSREWGPGGGRVLNGETNLGGGILVIPHWHYDEGQLTSTLVHELGHTFGLVHCWDRAGSERFKVTSQYKCYYDQFQSRSVMGYRASNHSNEMDPAKVPGCLLGDEIHALTGNKNLLPDLYFNPATDFDCPPASRTCPAHDGVLRQAYMGPMHMLWFTTGFESMIGGGTASRLNDTPSRWILSSHPEIGFVGEHMWHSSQANEAGWVSLDVTFSRSVTLNRLLVYTEHSGQYHRAHEVQLEKQVRSGFEPVVHAKTPSRDAEIEFPAAKAQRWRIALKAGASGQVVVRGVRFFLGDEEWFPPLGPHASTDFGATYGSRVSNLVEIQRVIRANGATVGFDARSMWHSGPVNELGWVSVRVVFPTMVTLDRVRVYSQHSGKYHRAKRIQVEVADGQGEYTPVTAKTVSKANNDITFAHTTGKAWKLAFKGDQYVVIRGLRFFIDNAEFYPPGKAS